MRRAALLCLRPHGFAYISIPVFNASSSFVCMLQKQGPYIARLPKGYRLFGEQSDGVLKVAIKP